MTDESRETIASSYAEMRLKSNDRTLPITARCLESLIRLSTAHAKIRLSPTVEDCDCDAALRLISSALHGKLIGNGVHPRPWVITEYVNTLQIPQRKANFKVAEYGINDVDIKLKTYITTARADEKDVLDVDDVVKQVFSNPPSQACMNKLESSLIELESNKTLWYDQRSRELPT